MARARKGRDPRPEDGATPSPAGRRKLSWMRRWLSARGRSIEITKAGFVFISLTLAVGFAAINSGSNLLHVIFGVQLGVIVASGMLSERMVTRTGARRVVTSPLFAGAPGALRVDTHNRSERGVLYSVSIEDDDRFEGYGSMGPVFTLALGPDEQQSQHTSVTLPRRGRHRLPPAVAVTRFPFGLFVKRKEIDDAAEVLVYPRIRPIPGIGRGSAVLGEGESAGKIARAGEFYGLDEWRRGHELRRVHWPATARRGKLVVCDFEGEGDHTWILELGSGRAGEPAYEAAIEDLASRAVSALREGGFAVGLRVAGELVLPAASGAAQERRLLDLLATVGFEDPRDPTESDATQRRVA